MTAKRTPIHRPPIAEITPTAINLFTEMRAIRCTCKRIDWAAYWERDECDGCRHWWELHSDLHRELHSKPWEWPCIEHPDARSPYPNDSPADLAWRPDEQAQALWRALDEAAAQDAAEASTSAPPSHPPG
jgi:hypothetical protein